MNSVDWDAALESVNADQGLLLEVLAILQQELPGLHDALRQAVANNNADELRQTAHKLKGSVRFLGPNKVHDIAEQIELMDSNDPPDVNELCVELSDAIEALSLDLKAYVSAAESA